MNSIEFVARLGPDSKATKTASGIQCRCPAHDDNTPSLSVSDAPDGKVLVFCHHGCTFEDICEKAGVAAADLVGIG